MDIVIAGVHSHFNQDRHYDRPSGQCNFESARLSDRAPGRQLRQDLPFVWTQFKAAKKNKVALGELLSDQLDRSTLPAIRKADGSEDRYQHGFTTHRIYRKFAGVRPGA
jgi:hypothetical protein